jgi:mono/diheme cytochrome c family protein
MERGVVIGGVLISASFLFAVLLNNCAGDKGPLPEADAQPAPPPTQATAPAQSPVLDNPGFYLGEATLNPSERAGREIWYKSTAGNSRFHTYTFQQRVGVLIDWYRVLRSDERSDRFAAWGIINDPGCCVPGSKDCPAKSPDDTYGFDWCPGDEQLLQFVGREGYRDPACDFKDAPADTSDVHNRTKDQRQSSCDLAFGTSTGALGIRKFPNPRFNRERWLALNGTAANWSGYNGKLSNDKANSDSHVSRLADGSVEPPFLIGISCGSCHIAFDPLNPPADPANPQWANLKGAVGNQYTRISEILSSGMTPADIEFQVFSHARPGTSDTSAVPTDQINNPGTINAIINIHQRPTFQNEVVDKWRKVAACPAGEGPAKQGGTEACWCEPGHDEKCWQRSTRTETVHHILKGGEDSIGALEAIQRVYFNIGSCAEQCWVNHLTDLRQIDPHQRNFGQTPFDIGQCRRDCPNFRAIEDRLQDIMNFLTSSETHATDLQVARENELKKANPRATYTRQSFVADLEREFGAGSVARGREVFAGNCARCHSSIAEKDGGPFANRDFAAIDAKTGLRADWLGNDQATPVTGVGTFRCRALHTNHMKDHVWQEYGSETLRSRPADPAVKEVSDGGRGYYRNISLLSLWAHAPFLHNNALGPELCGKPANAENDFYRSPFADAQGKALAGDAVPACWKFDPSVKGRFDLYKASMNDLLNPDQRVPKITRFSDDVPIAFGPRLWDGKEERQVVGFSVTIPAGATAGALGNFQHKRFAGDLVLSALRPDELHAQLKKSLGEKDGGTVFQALNEVRTEITRDPSTMVDEIRKRPFLLEAYSSCTATIENEGHRFGEGLSAQDKKALTAFLATM